MGLKLVIKGVPQPKQSARFRIVKTKDKQFVQSYQSKEVVDNERNIAFDIKSQLPIDFIPFSSAIGMKAIFIFPPLSSWPKKKIQELSQGSVIFKDTKPDLTDNLMKGLCDAMSGIVFIDDAKIAEVKTRKIYGFVPRIEIEFYEL